MADSPGPADGFFRLAAVAMRKYSRSPSERPSAARMLLSAAICLMAEETSPGAAALTTSETLALLARTERQRALVIRPEPKEAAR